MRITGSFEPVILIRFYRGVISQPLFVLMVEFSMSHEPEARQDNLNIDFKNDLKILLDKLE